MEEHRLQLVFSCWMNYNQWVHQLVAAAQTTVLSRILRLCLGSVGKCAVIVCQGRRWHTIRVIGQRSPVLETSLEGRFTNHWTLLSSVSSFVHATQNICGPPMIQWRTSPAHSYHSTNAGFLLFYYLVHIDGRARLYSVLSCIIWRLWYAKYS